MKILDVDLDFFLSNKAEAAWNYDGRVEEHKHYEPLSEDKVRHFLEEQCGLSRNRLVPGLTVVRHHEVFKAWRAMISMGLLQAPFDVVHVDAHADLGMGDAGWSYIMGNLLHHPINDRLFPREGFDGLDEGNYLAFAIACRWLSSLTYVCGPRWEDDEMPFYFKDLDTSGPYIQLCAYPEDVLETADFMKNHEPLSIEPEVAFEKIRGSEYMDTSNFDFMFLACSPRYTPPSADRLIPVIESYFEKMDIGPID